MARKNEKKSPRTASSGTLKTLSENDLGAVVGGLQFTFKLVAVKTISWSGGGQESPKE